MTSIPHHPESPIDPTACDALLAMLPPDVQEVYICAAQALPGGPNSPIVMGPAQGSGAPDDTTGVQVCGLMDAIGPADTAALLGVDDGDLLRYAAEEAPPTDVTGRIRASHAIVRAIASVHGDAVARTWLHATNGRLHERQPLRALAQAQTPDEVAPVLHAAWRFAAIRDLTTTAIPSDAPGLTLEETARQLGTSPEHVRRLVASAYLPAVYLPTRDTYRFSRRDLDAYEQDLRRREQLMAEWGKTLRELDPEDA